MKKTFTMRPGQSFEEAIKKANKPPLAKSNIDFLEVLTKWATYYDVSFSGKETAVIESALQEFNASPSLPGKAEIAEEIKKELILILKKRVQNLIASDLISPLFWEDFADEIISMHDYARSNARDELIKFADYFNKNCESVFIGEGFIDEYLKSDR